LDEAGVPIPRLRSLTTGDPKTYVLIADQTSTLNSGREFMNSNHYVTSENQAYQFSITGDSIFIINDNVKKQSTIGRRFNTTATREKSFTLNFPFNKPIYIDDESLQGTGITNPLIPPDKLTTLYDDRVTCNFSIIRSIVRDYLVLFEERFVNNVRDVIKVQREFLDLMPALLESRANEIKWRTAYDGSTSAFKPEVTTLWFKLQDAITVGVQADITAADAALDSKLDEIETKDPAFYTITSEYIDIMEQYRNIDLPTANEKYNQLKIEFQRAIDWNDFPNTRIFYNDFFKKFMVTQTKQAGRFIYKYSLGNGLHRNKTAAQVLTEFTDIVSSPITDQIISDIHPNTDMTATAFKLVLTNNGLVQILNGTTNKIISVVNVGSTDCDHAVQDNDECSPGWDCLTPDIYLPPGPGSGRCLPMPFNATYSSSRAKATTSYERDYWASYLDYEKSYMQAYAKISVAPSQNVLTFMKDTGSDATLDKYKRLTNNNGTGPCLSSVKPIDIGKPTSFFGIQECKTACDKDSKCKGITYNYNPVATKPNCELHSALTSTTASGPADTSRVCYIKS
jgi:hypothetical protein